MKLATPRFLSILFFTVAFSAFSQTNTPCSSGTPQATVLPVNTSCSYTAGTSASATAQTNAANGGTPSCSLLGPDVWYRFVAPASGSVIISTQAGTITDGAMALYSGTCGAFTELACNDDAVGMMPQITTTGLTPGQTYYIRFWKYNSGTGTFSICVQSINVSPQGNNTTCATPSPICSGSPISFVANAGGGYANAINPGNNYNCLISQPNPSWYYLQIAQAGNLVIDITAGDDVDFAIWGPYTNLAQAQSSCNSYPTPLDCSFSSSEIEQAVVNSVTVGQVYVLLVTNYADAIQVINVNQAAANTATTNCAIVPLPVGYSSWDATVLNEDVLLTWSTESEQDNNYFAVQRSVDGLVWETISIVNGHGTTDVAHAYSYSDRKPAIGLSYYRLMQVDIDGALHFTSILSVNTAEVEQLSVYPNPAGENFTVRVAANELDELLLTDIVGKTFRPAFTESQQGVTVDCSHLAVGMYTLSVIRNGVRSVQRVHLTK